ncbi:MAG: hypothetical protein LBK41_09090, partial [Clostridiales bacterium]|nr:hypothetical protein [Clostridiales bacterium]
IYYSKNHHSDIIKITHPQNEDRLNSRFVLGVGDFSVDIYIRHIQAAFLIEDGGQTYRLAPDHIKRILNQAPLEYIWVESNNELSAELAKRFF